VTTGSTTCKGTRPIYAQACASTLTDCALGQRGHLTTTAVKRSGMTWTDPCRPKLRRHGGGKVLGAPARTCGLEVSASARGI
jgi:hypothetical protein